MGEIWKKWGNVLGQWREVREGVEDVLGVWGSMDRCGVWGVGVWKYEVWLKRNGTDVTDCETQLIIGNKHFHSVA